MKGTLTMETPEVKQGTCPYCLRSMNARGLGSHKKTCPSKPADVISTEDPRVSEFRRMASEKLDNTERNVTMALAALNEPDADANPTEALLSALGELGTYRRLREILDR